VLMAAIWQQIHEDEELARRLYAEEMAQLEAVTQHEPIDLEQLEGRGLEQERFREPEPAAKRRRMQECEQLASLDPVMAASHEEREEVEEMWACWLRGEKLDEGLQIDSGAKDSQAYALHAIHALMTEFRKAPAPTIRAAFEQAGTYSQARSILEASEDNESLKCCRPKKPAPPCEVPAMLQKEMDLGPDAVAIGEAFTKRKQARAERIRELKALGGLGTCGCCFDDELLPEEELRCTGAAGHGFCIPCVKRAALEFFGRGLFTLNLSGGSTEDPSSSVGRSDAGIPGLSCSKLGCLDTSGCQGHFTDTALRKALPKKDYARYSRRSAALEAANSGLTDLVACPSCDFMVQMTDPNDGIVRCLDPECGQTTCRWCMKPEHSPLKCDEVEKDGETKIRTFLEERMAEAALRRCPNKRCRKPYEREEGCNHIKCPCGTHSCYLCGQELDKKRPYDHYKDGHLGGGKNDDSSKCIVYGTPAWAEKTAKQRQQETEEALKQYLKENPELKEIAAGSSEAKKKRLKQLMQTTPEKRNRGKSRKENDIPNLQVDTACAVQ